MNHDQMAWVTKFLKKHYIILKTPSPMGFILKMYQFTKEKIYLLLEIYQKASYISIKVIFKQKSNNAPL